jgi:hypothetical protein
MFAKDEPVDPITLSAELTKHGEIARVGGAIYIHTLVQLVPSAANASYYAEIVAGAAKLRRLAEAGPKIENMAYAAQGDADEIANAAGAEFNAAVTVREQKTIFRPADRSAALMDRLEARGRGEITRGVPIGFADLDSLTNGVHGGQMIVVAARPSMGKSTLAVDFVRAASVKQGKVSALFSLEKSGDDIHERILSAEARVALHHMISGIFDDPHQTALQIKAQASPPAAPRPRPRRGRLPPNLDRGVQAKLDGRQGNRDTDAQRLTVPADLSAQQLGAHGHAVGRLALRVGQVPAATPPRVKIHNRTVKPHTAPYTVGGRGTTQTTPTRCQDRRRAHRRLPGAPGSTPRSGAGRTGSTVRRSPGRSSPRTSRGRPGPPRRPSNRRTSGFSGQVCTTSTKRP